MKNIVTAKWLRDNMEEEKLVILDCRFDLSNPEVGEGEYLKAHIPNAYYLHLERDLSGEKGEHGGRHPLPKIDEFKLKLEALGINNDSLIVVYDSGDIAVASRLWWMLKYIGLARVYVLDGGFFNWVKHGYATTEIIPKATKKGEIDVKLKAEMLCDMDTVKNSIGDRNTIIIDSRAGERYKGEVEPMDKKAGHIPSAVNYFWQEVLNGNEVKSLGELKESFKDLDNYDKIIVHCGSGITACPNILAMDEIGINPRLYLGGWSDWVSYDENPIV